MTTGQQGRSKVERVIDAYGLTGLGEELEERWTREEDRYSLRALADYFNERVLRASMEAAGMRPLEGEVDNTYRLLTDADVSSGAQRQAERTLEREGIDVDDLRTDFVSHQAVHTYLREHRGASQNTERTPEERRQKARDTIERLRSRTEAVTANTLEGLARSDQLPVEEFDVVADVRVVDTETGEAYDVDDLLRSD
ncbi:MAG: rod-determining factor RdfA [Haloferacaceae archaeon]